MAFIKLVLKQGAQKSEASSDRPLSLTSHLIEIFERVLKRVLQKHL